MFYDVFLELCKSNGVTPNKSLTDCKISRTSTAKWKSGATPNGATLQKLADYFGVTTDYLLTGENAQKAPTPEGERKVNDDDIKFALFGDVDIDDDLYDEVKRFARFAKAQKEERKKQS